MKRIGFCVAIVMVGAALVMGVLGAKALAKDEPPAEELDWIRFPGGPGYDRGPGPDKGPGMRKGAGPGDMNRRMNAKQRRLERLKQDAPERYERLEKIRELSIKYRGTDDEETKQKIEKELRPLIEKELKVQHEENKKRIKELEERLARMKEVMERREKNWDQVVDYAFEEATGQNAYLKAWRGGRGPRR